MMKAKNEGINKSSSFCFKMVASLLMIITLPIGMLFIYVGIISSTIVYLVSDK